MKWINPNIKNSNIDANFEINNKKIISKRNSIYTRDRTLINLYATFASVVSWIVIWAITWLLEHKSNNSVMESYIISGMFLLAISWWLLWYFIGKYNKPAFINFIKNEIELRKFYISKLDEDKKSELIENQIEYNWLANNIKDELLKELEELKFMQWEAIKKISENKFLSEEKKEKLINELLDMNLEVNHEVEKSKQEFEENKSEWFKTFSNTIEKQNWNFTSDILQELNELESILQELIKSR